MGSLDDAIREHLELKRRLGASDDEIKEKESEAFGKGNRPAPAGPDAAEPAPVAEPDPFVDEDLAAAEPAPNGQHGTEEWHPADFPSSQRPGTADEIFEPDEVPADESLTVRDERRLQEDPAKGAPRGGRSRGDAGVPRGDARARPPLVRAAPAEGLRLRLNEYRRSVSGSAGGGRKKRGRRIQPTPLGVRAAPLRGASLSRGPEFRFRALLIRHGPGLAESRGA